MQTETRLIANCIGLLAQAIDLVERIGPDVYRSRSPLSPRGSIGGHLRHIVDFYQSFLAGLGSGRINYNRRQRDVLMERDGVTAIERIGETIAALQSLPVLNGDQVILVSGEEQGPDDGAVWCRSSILRELDFLQSHTVHHYSLVAMLLRLHEIEPGDEFGVASSTLKYWQEEAACAQ